MVVLNKVDLLKEQTREKSIEKVFYFVRWFIKIVDETEACKSV